MDMYSLDETEDDYELNDFSIKRDKDKLIPFIKAALERQPNLKLWASPWSPPWWMKRNEDGSPRTQKDGGYIDFTEENMSAYGAYFRKFIDAYKAEGIHISMVSPQNEPTMWTGYSSCLWTGDELRDFIRDYLGPALEGTGVEIYLGTFTNSDDNLAFPALNDPDAKKYLSGITFQWWSYNLARSLYHTEFDLDMMQSETMCGDGWNNWQYAENQFDEMWMYFSNGITSYNMWNMVLDWNGTTQGGANTTGGWYQNAPITVNESTKEYSLNPHYYEIRHYSSYVQPGARRIESGGTYDMAYAPSQTSDKETDATYTAARREIAFRNPDGTIALMVKNGEGSAQDVDINFNGRKISVTLPAHSISTFTTQGTPLTGKETDMTEMIPRKEIVAIKNVETGKALCVNGGGTASLSDLIQWDYSGQANQHWYLDPVSDGDTPTVKLVNIKGFNIAAVNGGSFKDGERLILWPYAGSLDHHWIMEKSGDYYKFKNGNSGMYMTFESAQNLAKAVQKPASDSRLQLWEVVPAYPVQSHHVTIKQGGQTIERDVEDGKVIVCSSDTPVAWTIGGETLAIGKKFRHIVTGDVTIEAVDPAGKEADGVAVEEATLSTNDQYQFVANYGANTTGNITFIFVSDEYRAVKKVPVGDYAGQQVEFTVYTGGKTIDYVIAQKQ